jgi:transaldolase
MISTTNLRIKIFADGADLGAMREMARHPWIKGFTTNPTLMRRAGVSDYRQFAVDALAAVPDRPISFEVFSDEFEEMAAQAREIATWGEHVYVKIPVTNTRGEPTTEVIRELTHAGVKVNVTAILALDQVRTVSAALAGGSPAYVSVFAGRVADTGRDPVPLMAAAVELVAVAPGVELIWASPREVLNILQADAVGCHVITVTTDLLKRLEVVGRDLHAYSLETVRMFHDDAKRAGYTLPTRAGSKA